MWEKKWKIWTETYFTKEDIWLGNNHIKSYSTPWLIREMQIKVTIRYGHTPTYNEEDLPTCPHHVRCACGATGTFIHHCWWCKMAHPYRKTVCRFRSVNIYLPYGPVIPFQGIFPRDRPTYARTKACTRIFSTALCATAPNWKQPKCSTTDEQTTNLWYITQENNTQQ